MHAGDFKSEGSDHYSVALPNQWKLQFTIKSESRINMTHAFTYAGKHFSWIRMDRIIRIWIYFHLSAFCAGDERRASVALSVAELLRFRLTE